MASRESMEQQVILDKLMGAYDPTAVSEEKENAVERFVLTSLVKGNPFYDAQTLSQMIVGLEEDIATLGGLANNSAERPIPPCNRITAFFRKTVRSLLRWYIDAPWKQQKSFNDTTVFTSIKLKTVQNEILSALAGFEQQREQIFTLIQTQKEELELLRRQTSHALRQTFEETRREFDENLQKLGSQVNHNSDLLQQYMRDQARFNGGQEEANASFNARMSLLESMQKLVNTRTEEIAGKISSLPQSPAGIGKDPDAFWDKPTFSQSGEDAIVAYVLMVLGIPFSKTHYLDLGANHAKNLSNTFALYNLGAQGVLVEANPRLIPELNYYRSRDIVLNKCIAPQTGGTLDFYILSGDGLSTPDYNSVQDIMRKNPAITIAETVSVETVSVNDLFKLYFSQAPEVLNVDIEGMTMEIMQSVDFEAYRPLMIIIEVIDYKPTLVVNEKNQEIGEYLKSKDYVEYAFTGINSIFLDSRRFGEETK